MKRLASIIFCILIGALAVAIGMGIYLNKANHDRERLEQVAREAQDKSRDALDKSQQAIQEANNKLQAANDEVTKAQEALKAVEQEREALAKADALAMPTAKELKGWQEVLSLPQGLTLKCPPTSLIEANDEQALTLTTKPAQTTANFISSDARWLSITPYDLRLENELSATVSSSTAVAYAVRGRLLSGIKGLSADAKSEIFVLRIQSMGKVTHLVWGRQPTGKATQDSVLQSLSTLTFQK